MEPGRELRRELHVAVALEHAERRVRRAREVLRLAVRADRERRHVPGAREVDAAVVGLHDQVEQRGHLAAVETSHQAVEPVEHAGGRVALERVGARRVAQLAHQRGRSDAVADHVAHRHAHAAAVERDGVVPVAAHVGATRHVARGDLDALHLGQPVRQQAALEQLDVRDLALVRARVLDGEAGPVRHQDQQALLLERERPRRAHRHLDHAGEPALHHERRGHQRAHARRGHHRVESAALGDLLERHRPARRHHLLERVADLDRRPGLHVIQTGGGTDGVEPLVLVVLKQDAHDVGGEHLARAAPPARRAGRAARGARAPPR